MTKRTYSKAQAAYMVAKANLEVAEQEQAVAERIYIIKRRITNPDGTIPEKLYMIRDKKSLKLPVQSMTNTPNITQYGIGY